MSPLAYYILGLGIIALVGAMVWFFVMDIIDDMDDENTPNDLW